MRLDEARGLPDRLLQLLEGSRLMFLLLLRGFSQRVFFEMSEMVEMEV